MGLDIGHFGKIEYFTGVPEPVKDFFKELLQDDDFTACHGDGQTVILTFVGDLLYATKLYAAKNPEVEAWIRENIKPVADKDGYVRLYLNW